MLKNSNQLAGVLFYFIGIISSLYFTFTILYTDYYFTQNKEDIKTVTITNISDYETFRMIEFTYLENKQQRDGAILQEIDFFSKNHQKGEKIQLLAANYKGTTWEMVSEKNNSRYFNILALLCSLLLIYLSKFLRENVR